MTTPVRHALDCAEVTSVRYRLRGTLAMADGRWSDWLVTTYPLFYEAEEGTEREVAPLYRHPAASQPGETEK